MESIANPQIFCTLQDKKQETRTIPEKKQPSLFSQPNEFSVSFTNFIQSKPKEMKTWWFIIVCLFLSLQVFGQKNMTQYTGVNGRITQEGEAIRKKEISVRSDRRINAVTYALTDGQWQKQYREKIRKEKNETYTYNVKGPGISENFTRIFDHVSDSLIRFMDHLEGRKMKEGNALSKFPLILHGEVTEYYPSGQVKSQSLYRNNELVSNRNWLPSGEKYIDNIFYSADREPLYSLGMGQMHRHFRQAFLNSGLDISHLTGQIIIGFVVMETGEIVGPRIVSGMTSGLNSIALEAAGTLMGKWQPAMLHGKEVRYFQTFPIQFMHRENIFQNVEFDGTMIHWDIN